MGLPVGIIIFYFLFFSIEIVTDKKDIADYSTFIIICAVFLIWKAVLFFFHWKLWRTIWHDGPLFSKLSDEGFSFVMPYNVDDDGEQNRDHDGPDQLCFGIGSIIFERKPARNPHD